MAFRLIAVLGMAWVGLAAGAEPGLLARYSDGGRTVVSVVATPAFTLAENESVHPQVGAGFTAVYEGSLKILRRGTYTFAAGGGAKVLIDGKEVDGAVELESGEHAFSVTVARKAGAAARLQVVWSSPSFVAEPLPAGVLSHAVTPAEREQARVERGRMLAEEHNCAACHKGGAANGLAGRVGPDLTNVGARASAGWIYTWLEDPRHFRKSAVMPAMLGDEDDRRDVAAYLATLKDAKRKVTEYKGSAQKAKQGKELFETIGCANCHGAEGAEGAGVGAMGSKSSIGALAAYLENPLEVDRSGRMPGMGLTKEESVAIANHLVGVTDAAYEAKLPAGADVARGGQIVRSVGCLNCHAIGGEAGKPVADAKKFVEMGKLEVGKGCLAEKPIEAPRYGFSKEEREALAAFVTSVKAAPLISSAPAQEFHRTLARLNCAACHETDAGRPEGEGAEVLPPLTNVGAKLKREWIGQVLNDKKARVRFWLKTRMPEFGGAVSKVPAQAVAAAGVDEGAEAKVTAVKPEVIKRGQELVGANDPKKNPAGMGCVTCHSLREFKPAVTADATRGPELTLMSARLRADFFDRWMREPARIQPGTAMPNFFTDKAHGEATATIETLWGYASLGVGMPAPKGVKEKKNYILIVTDTPMVSRCQVPDPAGTIVYGISVGLPSRVNYVFDAEHVMFRAAWTGGFLDMSGDWDGRGGNPVKVLGQRFYAQAAPAIHIGAADADSPRVFKGYELKDRIPTFIYTVGEVEVRERITALEGGVGVVRAFELYPAGKAVFFTAADEAGVTLTPSLGEFRAGEVLKSYKGTEKVAGRVLELPAAKKLMFSVTVRAKDGK